MKKKLALALAIIMSFSALSGCANDTKTDNTLSVVMIEDPSTCDIQKTTDYYTLPLNIYDRLLDCQTVDGQATLMPGLAESWDISDDGLVYIFHLRSNVKFHNGEVFKADDVLYTIDRMMNPVNETVNTDFYDMIVGAKAVFAGEATTVSGVKVIDDQTVEMTLEYPFGAFLANLAAAPCSMYNRKATEEAGDQFGIDPAKTIGTGPFILSEWKLNDHIKMKTNPDYWQGASKLDAVVFKNMPDADTQRMAFEKGELDVFNVAYGKSQLPYFKSSDKWKENIIRGTQANSTWYNFNIEQAPFNDINVRKAIAYAIDRQALLDNIYDGEGDINTHIVPKGVAGYNPDLIGMEYDVEKSKEYLAKAGYPDGGLKITIDQNGTNATTTNLNVAIQDMLKKVGIEAEINQLDSAAYLQLRSEGKLGMVSSGWLADYNDPDNFLYTYFSESKTKVYSINYYEPSVINGIESARKEVDNAKRMKMYNDAESKIIEDCVVVPLLQPLRLFVLGDRVKNFKIAWNGWSDMSYYGIEIQN